MIVLKIRFYLYKYHIKVIIIKVYKDYSLVISGAAGQGVQTVEQFLVGILKRSNFNIFATKEYESRIRGGINSTELRVSPQRDHRVNSFVDRIDLLVALKKEAFSHLSHRISVNTIIITDPDPAGTKNTTKSNSSQSNKDSNKNKNENSNKNSNENKDISSNNIIEVNLNTAAKDLGGSIYTNIISVGIICKIFNVEDSVAKDYIKHRFKEKGQDVINSNILAFEKGGEIISPHLKSINNLLGLTSEIGPGLGENSDEIKNSGGINDEILFNGNEGIAYGALAGGCNFISAYPMSPSTGVLMTLAKHSKDFSLLIDQAEDEIAAINKTIGAWYAGARAIASTSGGGFALMEEGISLAGITETPVVIHLAQRPGPATGLPTRTAQEDLNFAIHAGHGEFCKMIFAPGTIEQAFYLTQFALNLADKLQIPIIILTDQYFVDSYYNIPPLDLNLIKNKKFIAVADANYKRYKLNESGVSPRGVPGYGKGLIRVDSDEHDENGHITEDLLDTRIKMVEKRFLKRKKLTYIHSIPPLYLSPDYFMNNTNRFNELESKLFESFRFLNRLIELDYNKKDTENTEENLIPNILKSQGDNESNQSLDLLVVCWGSTFHAIREAIIEYYSLNRNLEYDKKKIPSIGLIYFSQVYPMTPWYKTFIERIKYKSIVSIEMNAAGQFASLLKSELNIKIQEENQLNIYSGEPLSVERVLDFIQSWFNRNSEHNANNNSEIDTNKINDNKIAGGN